MLGIVRKHRPAAIGATLLAIGTFSTFAATNRPADPGESIARVDRAQGEARIERNGILVPLTSGQAVARRDQFATGNGGRVVLTFNDGSRLAIGENALLGVADFVAEEGRKTGALILDLFRGAIRLSAAKPIKAPDKRVEVRTPVATISSQAVDMWSGPIDGQLGVFVMAGKLDVRNDAGWVILDRKRAGTLVAHRMIAPAKPGLWSAEQANRMLMTVALKQD